MAIHLDMKVSFLEDNGSIGMNFVNDIGPRGLRLKLALIKVRSVVRLLSYDFWPSITYCMDASTKPK